MVALNGVNTPIAKIPDVVILPDSNSMKLLGVMPTVITIDDMTSVKSWLELVINHNQYLEMSDFKSRDLFDKYWLLSLGLLEFPVQFIGGNRGGGKSLYMSWFTHKTAKLFGKRSTLDWTPPNAEYYRPYNAKIRLEQIEGILSKLENQPKYDNYKLKLNEEKEFIEKTVDLTLPPYFSIYDEDYIETINSEFNRLNRMEKAKEGEPKITRQDMEKFMSFNTNFGLDECDWAERSNRTNFTKFVAMMARRFRHVFCGMSLVMIDINRFDLLLEGLCTHKVNCIWEGHFPETSSILVEDARRNGTGVKKWLFLRPKECLHLWDSHNIPQMIHNVDISFGKPKKKKLTQEDL